MKCELCGTEIGERPFALSSLAEPPRILKVCESCAGSDWITIKHDDEVEVEVLRDDYIIADKDRFFQAVDDALYRIEEQGWTCDFLKLRAHNEERIQKPPL